MKTLRLRATKSLQPTTLSEEELMSRVTTEALQPQSVKEKVLSELAIAQAALSRAYQEAVKAQPLAADIPVFLELQVTGKRMSEFMQQVSKLRGL